jgi:hypothetical protein
MTLRRWAQVRAVAGLVAFAICSGAGNRKPSRARAKVARTVAEADERDVVGGAGSEAGAEAHAQLGTLRIHDPKHPHRGRETI